GGMTQGSFQGYTLSGTQDAFIAQYDTSGNQNWVRQLGTSGSDTIYAMTIDSTQGALDVGGIAGGTFSGQTSAGGNDAFIAQYDTSGNQTWLRQFGTSSTDEVNTMVFDSANGALYVGGFTSGTLSGQTSAGGQDAFLAKF